MEKNSHRGSKGAHGFSDLQSEETSVSRTFLLACRVRLYAFVRFIQNLFSYYIWYPRFFCADILILLQYFFKSPYTLIRQYDDKNPEAPVGPYGETDFCTFDTICTAFKISPSDTFADLGAGRGRLAFFLKLVRQQRSVIAYEKVPILVKRAKKVQKLLSIEGLHFLHEDWLSASLHDIDIIYLYSLSLDAKAAKKLADLPKTTKIITIGSPLSEEFPKLFHLEKKIPIRFSWGTTEAYLQRPV